VDVPKTRLTGLITGELMTFLHNDRARMKKVHDFMSENWPGTSPATPPETDKSIIGISLPSLARTLF
jgi:hypothetical protein